MKILSHKIATEIGKFVWEVEEYMDVGEYMDWYHYFEYQQEIQKEANKKASKKQK
jgi:hypothetical protein